MLSYLVPVPFLLFLEQMIGPGWKLSIRRLWRDGLVLGRTGEADDDLTLVVLRVEPV